VNWYSGDEFGKGGIYNFVTKRVYALANSKISWTQVETGLQLLEIPSCILMDNSQGEFYSVR
jgi:Fe-S cluster assembly protein SufB